MEKIGFNADNAEEYFADLCAHYRTLANEVFARDNEGRHASEQMYSAEYQKYIGAQMAMKEVLDYFSKFDLAKHQTNADRIRAMSDEELAGFLNRVKEPCNYCQLAVVAGACTETLCDDAMEEWLKQPVKEEL